jgi:hypothetical protein
MCKCVAFSILVHLLHRHDMFSLQTPQSAVVVMFIPHALQDFLLGISFEGKVM